MGGKSKRMLARDGGNVGARVLTWAAFAAGPRTYLALEIMETRAEGSANALPGDQDRRSPRGRLLSGPALPLAAHPLSRPLANSRAESAWVYPVEIGGDGFSLLENPVWNLRRSGQPSGFRSNGRIYR